MGKSARNKKRSFENYQMNYSDEGSSWTNRQPLTQEEASCEEIAIDIYKRFSILEEARPIIETMAYKEEAIKKVMGEALKEKEDHGAFVIPFHLEAKINLNALADTGSQINVIPFRIYAKLGRDEVKPVNQEITMLNHSKADPMGLLKDVLCQINVTTEESDNEDDEDYCIKRNSLGAPIYGTKSSKYLNCNDPMDRALTLQGVLNPFRKICVWKKAVGFLGSLPVPLQHLEWILHYEGNFCRKEDGDKQWHVEIRLTDPYGNIYDQGFKAKPTNRKLSKYHKLSDVMSPNWFHK
ncbi:reverse transcriptase domain-containing protein [Tanacetum coccineum]